MEKQIENDASNAEAYIKALQSELRARGHLIALLEQAEKFYIAQRGEVKVVANVSTIISRLQIPQQNVF